MCLSLRRKPVPYVPHIHLILSLAFWTGSITLWCQGNGGGQKRNSNLLLLKSAFQRVHFDDPFKSCQSSFQVASCRAQCVERRPIPPLQSFHKSVARMHRWHLAVLSGVAYWSGYWKQLSASGWEEQTDLLMKGKEWWVQAPWSCNCFVNEG